MQIYKTTNLINSKIYIGKDVTNRMHYLGSGLALKSAIKKYGVDSFKKVILEDNITDKRVLADREKYWISYYKSNNPIVGYNLTKGGDGGDICQGRITINKNNIEKKVTRDELESYLSDGWRCGLSEDHILKSKINRKGKCLGKDNGNYGNPTGFRGNATSFKPGELHPMFNKKQSVETINKRVSTRAKNGTLKNNGSEKRKKPILQYDLSGNFIKEWLGVREAMNEYNQARVGDVANGKAKTAGGYYWKWKN
jgi:group I intron endonuclease